MPSRHAIRRQRAELKASIAYVASTPRCERCDHFLDAETIQISIDRRAYSPAICGLHKLPIQPMGLCDSWEHSGETLES